MALNVPVDWLIKSIGHDGSEIIWPHLPEPMCRRGFHSQELVRECLKRGYFCTPVEVDPVIAPASGDGTYHIHPDPPDHYLRAANCVIECLANRCRHAVHGRHGSINDPDGRQYDVTDLSTFGLTPYRIWIIA